MLTFISFLLVIAGAMNWLSVGFLQYDFIAGIFGTQASVLSRVIYIIVGLGAFWILIMAIKHGGKIDIFNRRFKKTIQHSDILADEPSATTAKGNNKQ